MLRTTVPRLDQFNCLERVMCEVAAPFVDDEPERSVDIIGAVLEHPVGAVF